MYADIIPAVRGCAVCGELRITRLYWGKRVRPTAVTGYTQQAKRDGRRPRDRNTVRGICGSSAAQDAPHGGRDPTAGDPFASTGRGCHHVPHERVLPDPDAGHRVIFWRDACSALLPLPQ